MCSPRCRSYACVESGVYFFSSKSRHVVTSQYMNNQQKNKQKRNPELIQILIEEF